MHKNEKKNEKKYFLQKISKQILTQSKQTKFSISPKWLLDVWIQYCDHLIIMFGQYFLQASYYLHIQSSHSQNSSSSVVVPHCDKVQG